MKAGQWRSKHKDIHCKLARLVLLGTMTTLNHDKDNIINLLLLKESLQRFSTQYKYTEIHSVLSSASLLQSEFSESDPECL
jgi:hypothetical protein